MKEDLKKFYKEHQDSNLILSDNAAQRVKGRVMANLGKVVVEDEKQTFWDKMRKMFLHGYVIVPIAILLFVTGTAYASANSLPGDTLYSVKRAAEEVRLAVTPTESAKLELELQFAQKRLDELETLRTKRAVQSGLDKKTSDDKQLDDSKNNKSGSDNKDEENDSDGRQLRARREANKAIDNLDELRKKWKDDGDKDKAKEIDRRLNQFRRQLHDGGGNNGDRDNNSRDNDSRGSSSGRGGNDSGSNDRSRGFFKF